MKTVIKNRMRLNSIGYSLSTWLRNIFILVVGLLLIVILLSKNYEQATINLVSSLNEEFSIHADQMSKQIQDSVINSAMQIYYSPAVTRLRTSENVSNFEKILGIRSMNAGMVSNDLIHSVYVYNESKDYIYTTYESGSFYRHEFFDHSGVQLLTSPTDYPKLTPIPRDLLWGDERETDQVYSFLVHDPSTNQVGNSMLMNIYAEAYNNIFFSPTTKEEEYMLILNSDEEIIASSTSYTEALQKIDTQVLTNNLDNTSTNGYFYSQQRGEKTIYFYTYMPESTWYFVKVIPYQQCMVGLNNMLYHAIIIALILLACGILIAYISMRRFYDPLKKIMSSLSLADETNIDISTDIMGDFDHFIATQKQANAGYQSLLKTEVLKHMLLSTSSVEHHLMNKFSQYNINFIHGRNYYMILFEAPSDFTCSMSAFCDDHWELIKIAENSLLILQPHADVTIESVCHYLLEQGIALCLYSQKTQDILTLKKSYIRLRELKQLHVFYPDMHMMSETWLLHKKSDNLHQDELETELITSIKSLDADKAINIYFQLINQCKNYRFSLILFNLKSLYLTLNSYYISLLSDTSTTPITPDMDTFEKKILHARSQTDIDCLFIAFIEQLIELKFQITEKQRIQVSQKVKAYIESNYTDYNLTLSLIASTFDIPSNKLSKSFKYVEGVTINDYINTLRIERSKELLSTTPCTIKEITKQIGIENTQYFYTLFKNNTGLTPSSYRQVSRLESL